MKKRRRSNKDLGIPEDIAPELREELARELERMGASYDQVAQSADPPLAPADVLFWAKRWNKLTPEQRAAWDAAAQRENLSGGDSVSLN